jgi:uncharacterized phage-associated protein
VKGGTMGTYSAIEIAKYMIKKCNDEECPITNLQVQKILYFLQREYLQNKGIPLFVEDIQAWQFGPVVPEVYYEYCAFGAMPITISNVSFEICSSDSLTIDPIIDDKKNKYPWDLVSETHKPGGAWEIIYDGGKGNKKVIPHDLICKKG